MPHFNSVTRPFWPPWLQIDFFAKGEYVQGCGILAFTLGSSFLGLLAEMLLFNRGFEVAERFQSMRLTGTAALIGVALTTCFGYGDRLPEVAPVSGRVTIDGKPVVTGSVQFWPEAGRPARGSIGADGRYRLSTFSTDDGALLGPHKVTIEATKVHDNGPRIESIEEEIEYYSRKDAAPLTKPVIERLVPLRYSKRESSNLTAEVERGDNPIDFDLPAEK